MTGSLSFDAFYEGERLGSVESDVINLQEVEESIYISSGNWKEQKWGEGDRFYDTIFGKSPREPTVLI